MMVDGQAFLRMVEAAPGDRITISKEQAMTIGRSLAAAAASGAMLTGQRRMDETIASLAQLAG